MRAGSRGFAYVWLLAAVAVFGAALAAVGPLWAEEAQREREDELLRVGRLYAEAIDSYHRRSPGTTKRYPARLEELLFDTRFVGTVRHLRVLYPDPMAKGGAWTLLRATDGSIIGVASTSDASPLRRVAVDLGVVRLDAASRYADWRFVPAGAS
jgi:type II secretory pathway pseudopilin PulG